MEEGGGERGEGRSEVLEFEEAYPIELSGVAGAFFLVGVFTGSGGSGGGVDVEGGVRRRRGGGGVVIVEVEVVVFFALFVPPFLELVVGRTRHKKKKKTKVWRMKKGSCQKKKDKRSLLLCFQCGEWLIQR